MENNGIYRGKEDCELVSLALGGDESATTELLTRYIPLVKSRASVFTSSAFEYDDMFQEGMIGLYGAIGSFNSSCGTPFSAFARLCVDRMMVAVLRASSRQRRIPAAKISNLEDAPHLAEAKLCAVDPEESLIAKEEFNRFRRKADSELSTLEIKVLNAFISGCNYGEISQMLGIPEKSVDNALQRIRRKLKK